jgi:hypothetical protein
MERFGRKLWWSNLRYYPGICLEGLKKTMNDKKPVTTADLWAEI